MAPALTNGITTINVPVTSEGATFSIFPTVSALPVDNLFVANGVSGAEVDIFPNTGMTGGIIFSRSLPPQNLWNSGSSITVLGPSFATPGDAVFNIGGGTILNGLTYAESLTAAGGSVLLNASPTTIVLPTNAVIFNGVIPTNALTLSGSVPILSGGTLTVAGNATTAGTLTLTGGTTAVLPTNAVIFNGVIPTNALTLSGSVPILSGGSLVLTGNTTTAGTLTLTGGTTAVLPTNAVIFNGVIPTNALTLSSGVTTISGGSLVLTGNTAVTDGTVAGGLASGTLALNTSGGAIFHNVTNAATTDGTITGVVGPSRLLQVTDLNAADGDLVLSPVAAPVAPTVTEITPLTANLTPSNELNASNESVGTGFSLPEPSTWSAVLIGGGALLALGRFRRRGLRE